MCHAACKVEFRTFTVVLTADVSQLFMKLLITILLFVVVKTIEDNSLCHPRFHRANTTMHGVWSSTAGTYVSRENIESVMLFFLLSTGQRRKGISRSPCLYYTRYEIDHIIIAFTHAFM